MCEMISVLEKFSSTLIDDKRQLQIQDILKPIIVLASIFGFLPHSVKFSKSKNRFEIIPNSIYLNCISTGVILLLLSTFLVFHIRHMFLFEKSKNDYNKEISTLMNYAVELVNFFIVCSTAYLHAFLNRSNYVKILNLIVSTWAITPSRKSQNILEKLRLQRNVILISLILILASQMYLNTGEQFDLWQMLFFGFTLNLPQVIQFSFHAFYTMLVLSTSAILCSIVSDCQSVTNEKFKFYPVLEVRPKMKKTRLRDLELVYLKAFKIKTDINDAFKGPLLASILQSFHALVSEAHILYHGVLTHNTMTTYGILNCSIWIICQFLKLYSLSYSGNLLKLQALRIGQTLHYIPTEKHDVYLLIEVQHFLTLLKCQSIELTVYDYFSLDAKFLFNLFTSASMYLIILVQID